MPREKGKETDTNFTFAYLTSCKRTIERRDIQPCKQAGPHKIKNKTEISIHTGYYYLEYRSTSAFAFSGAKNLA